MNAIQIHPYTLVFKRPAKTSRNTMTEKKCYVLTYGSPLKAIAECNLFEGLSADDRFDYSDRLKEACLKLERLLQLELPIEDERFNELLSSYVEFPSIQFGLEQLWFSFHSDDPFVLFSTPFSNEQQGIDINGLVWMGDLPFMQAQIDDLLERGFDCIKLKIGAHHFKDEYTLLKGLREKYSAEVLELRVDANGAYTPDEVYKILEQLALLEIHSIEQPIKAGQWDEMAQLCEHTPLPIALDEELIGLFNDKEKQRCISHIRPHYLILKPALIGGFKACDAYMELDTPWWITSALESNIGLNAIAQYTSTKALPRPQGLGTGSLFTNNFSSPLSIEEARLYYNKEVPWNINILT